MSDWNETIQKMLANEQPATRPQPSAEPVAEQAWTLTDHRTQEYRPGSTHNTAWTELHLNGRHIAHFPDREMAEVVLAALTQASALEAACREALEEAAKVADGRVTGLEPLADLEARTIAKRIRALKENPNAG